MIKGWKLPKPNLILTVIGGAKSYVASNLQQYRFRRGLVRAAQTTGHLSL